jgi:multiple sugar transport system substrate-binding protein
MSASVDRRRFLRTTAATAAGLSALAAGRPPAFAQKRELTFLKANHFVPASDDELRRQAEAFGKQAGVTVRVDTIAHLQLPAKFAAEVQAQSGHDMILLWPEAGFLYEHQLVDVADVVDNLARTYGGWYPFAEEMAKMPSGWRAVPWYWISFPGNYNEALFRKAGLTYPRTWDELLKHGKVLKKQGNPVGIPISHCSKANITFWSILWCYGGKVLEADGKTPALRSDQTAQVIEWYKELYADAMEPEVLSWDDASSIRFFLSGKGSWIHNPISPYNAALAKKMPIADQINHHPSPGGPAGTYSACPINGIGIWKFSRNTQLAKEFIKFHFQKENYEALIEASNAFNHPSLTHFADHPIWRKNPKLAMLPREAEYARARGWPAKPNAAVNLVDVNFILPDMIAKTLQGMPTRRAMDWAHEQVALAVRGKLETRGKA